MTPGEIEKRFDIIHRNATRCCRVGRHIVDRRNGVCFANWLLFGRRNTIRGFIDVLRENQFPPRFNKHDDFLNYLARIEGGSYSESLKGAANEFERVLGAIEAQGIIAGARIHAASEAALEAYSPRQNAPER